jgi:hypothetical protein
MKGTAMQIGSINSATYQPMGAGESLAKVKQSFQKLGSALESGNLSDAKEAMAELQKNAPAQAGGENSPMGAKIETLTKAVDSGDLKAAQQAYADIKKTMSQRPPPARGGGPAGGQGGAPPNGAKKSSSTSDSSSPYKTYDKKDTNKDGTVSSMEELAYSLKHPGETEQTSATAKVDSDNGSIDFSA